jgi:hypothetical protein
VSDRTAIIAKFAAVLVLLSISACARPIGDFGRAEASPLADSTAHVTDIAREISAPASVLNWTDEEREMRDRIWRYLVSPDGYDWLGDSFTELTRLGFGRAHFRPTPKDAYYRWLHGTTFASSPVRYARLSDDVEADLGMMPAVFAAICSVQQIDHQRGIAANGLPGVDPKMRSAAGARRQENDATVRWFSDSLDARYEGYSYALDNLLIDTPHDAAIAADSKLSELRAAVDAADSGDFCSELHGSSALARRGSTSSRYSTSAPGGS